MAWTTTPYCTLSDVKLAIDPNLSTSDDTFLTSLIPQVQVFIDEYVGYPFQTDGTTLAPATRKYNGAGVIELYIDPCLVLIQVQEIQRSSSVSNTGVWIASQVQTFDITADVLLGPNRVVNNGKPGYSLRRISGLTFTEGLQNYVIQGVFGYTSVPSPINRAAIRMCTHWYKMRDTNYSDMTTEQGGIREHYTKNMPVDVIEILDLYKHRRFFGGAPGVW